MASTLISLREKVKARIKDAVKQLSTEPDVYAELDEACLGALEEFSRALPRERAKAITGSGVFDYAVTGLTGWAEDFSVIRSLVYPYVAADAAPEPLDASRYGIVRAADESLKLRFFDVVPTAAEQFLATYTTPHTVDKDSSTIPASREGAFLQLWAAHAFSALAAANVQETDSTIGADSVQRQTKVDLYKGLAKHFRDLYKAAIQADESDGAACVIGTIPGQSMVGGVGTFFHDRR